MTQQTGLAIFKGVVAAAYTLFCMGIGLLPEIIMYLVWNMVAPETSMQKIALVAVFGFFGTGLSVLAAVGGFAMWIAGITGILDS